MRPFEITRQLAADDADGIFEAATLGAGGAITMDGNLVANGVAVMDVQRKVLLTTAADETGVTFTITGTDEAGNVISEVLAGVNNTTASTILDYKTVTSIVASAATTGDITFGTSAVGASQPFFLDRNIAPFELSLALEITGTVNVDVEFTLSRGLNTDVDGANALAAVWYTHATLDGETSSVSGVLNQAVEAIRLLTNSGTGTCVLRGIQPTRT